MSGAACNITRSGSRRRAGAGIVAALLAALAIVAFDGAFGSPLWRLGPAAALGFAFLALFQAQAGT